jgi:predicted nucleic acid-binding protein
VNLLDTSVLIRYFTGAPLELARRSRELIDGRDELAITDVAIAEVAWVLGSYYGIPREQIVDHLLGLLGRANIRTFRLEKHLVVEALMLCRPSARVSFTDALIWAAARSAGGATVYSFDRRFPTDGIEVRATP